MRKSQYMYTIRTHLSAPTSTPVDPLNMKYHLNHNENSTGDMHCFCLSSKWIKNIRNIITYNPRINMIVHRPYSIKYLSTYSQSIIVEPDMAS